MAGNGNEKGGQGQERRATGLTRPTAVRPPHPEALLRFCVTWNTNTRHCHEAQAVLDVLLHHEPPDELLAYEGVRTTLEALLPYTGICQGEGTQVGHWGIPRLQGLSDYASLSQSATFSDSAGLCRPPLFWTSCGAT